MALGLNYEPGTGGADILPIVKYNGKAGRMLRIDRAEVPGQGFQSTEVDITREFKAVFDMENIETGWINFPTNGTPDFSLTKLGSGQEARRPTDKHRPGARLMVKLGQDCAAGQVPVRELASTAKVTIAGLDKLHDAYLAGLPANPGKLPVVVIENTVPIVTEGGGQKSTNYEPVFKIAGWAPRPADLIYTPRGQSTATASASPPATGSTTAPPPSGQPAQAAAQAPAEEDFG